MDLMQHREQGVLAVPMPTGVEMREIKIVEKNGLWDVRNIPDRTAKGETVVAAVWQDGGVKIASTTGFLEILLKQAGLPVGTEPNATVDAFNLFVFQNWDWDWDNG